jgi:hypothetical protein
MAVEYTEDEYESGRCKGLFRFNRFTWLCENREECVRIKKTETEDERKLWLYGPVEKRRYRPKKMCPKCNGRLIIRYNYNICESCNTH